MKFFFRIITYLLLILSVDLTADTYAWNSNSLNPGTWNAIINWDPSTLIPGAGDTINLTNDGGLITNAQTIVLQNDTFIEDISVSNSTPYTFSGSALTISGEITATDNAQLLSNNTLNFPNDIRIASTGSVFQMTSSGDSAVFSCSQELDLADNVELILNGVSALSGDVVIGTGSSLTLTGDAVTPAGNVIFADETSSLTIANSGDNYAGDISGAGTLNIGQDLDSTIELSGDNSSFIGTVNLIRGTLQASSDAAFNDNVTVNWPGAIGATLDIQENISVGGITSIDNCNGTVNIASDKFLTLNNSASSSFSGDFTGFGSFVKAGAGNLTLSGDNTGYLGLIEIAEGSVTTGSTTALASSPYTLSGGSLIVSNNNSAGSITGAGGITIADTVTLTVGSNNLSTSFSGIISGDGSLTKEGGGTLTLSGNNSYQGITQITAGTLETSAVNTLSQLSDMAILAPASSLVINNNNSY